MQHIIRAMALIFVVAIFAMHSSTVSAEPKEGDWASGWNTWKDSTVGDWIEYSISGVAGIRQDVTAVKGDDITYTHKMLDKVGEVTNSKEYTKAWNKIKMQSKLPYGDAMEVTWTEVVVDFGAEKLNCDLAEWDQGKGNDAAKTQVYFCKNVSCGGIVKVATNGKDIVWMTGFAKAGAKVEGDPTTGQAPVKSKLPRFFASVDNKAVVKISGAGRDDMYQLRTVTDVAEEITKWTAVVCDSEGAADPKARLLEFEQTKEAWDKDYGKPAETGVTLKLDAGEFVCDVFKSTAEDGREITEWVSEGLSVKKIVKAKGKETTIEVVSYTMK
ncbi:MAG: hypothetical protein K8I27_05535 [Planctomycetes bacterium]|nr:hypothetical protein [Planctomycetota bacterium]